MKPNHVYILQTNSVYHALHVLSLLSRLRGHTILLLLSTGVHSAGGVPHGGVRTDNMLPSLSAIPSTSTRRIGIVPCNTSYKIDTWFVLCVVLYWFYCGFPVIIVTHILNDFSSVALVVAHILDDFFTDTGTYPSNLERYGENWSVLNHDKTQQRAKHVYNSWDEP